MKYFKKFLNLTYLIILNSIFFSFVNSNTLAEQKNELSTKCFLEKTKFVCQNLDPKKFKMVLMDEPFRIQLIFESELFFQNKKEFKNDFIKSVRFNKIYKSGSRLVIEFKKPTIISNISYNKTDHNYIDIKMFLSNTSAVNYAIAKHILSKNDGNFFLLVNDNKNLQNQDKNFQKKINISNNKQKIISKNKLKREHIVFIDPGHGGKDPGAIGQLGTLEKNITLKVSKLLFKALKNKNKIFPILSRKKDIYLSLQKRTLLAKNKKADIFISIHADSSKNKKANGISVFSLSDKASDKEAQMLAQRENEVDNLLDFNQKINDPLIYGSLIKMIQREAMNDSAYLAKKILLNLEKTKLAVNRGHRFAGFSVLKSYNIPSVLIEVGFLSNRQEEKKLLNPKYLSELSYGLADAIENYFLTNHM